MADPMRTVVRSVLGGVGLVVVLSPLVGVACLPGETRALRDSLDRIQVGMTFQEVMRIMPPQSRYSGRNGLGTRWELVKSSPVIPVEWKTKRATAVVVFERKTTGKLRVYQTQYQEKSLTAVLRDQWVRTFGVAAPF